MIESQFDNFWVFTGRVISREMKLHEKSEKHYIELVVEGQHRDEPMQFSVWVWKHMFEVVKALSDGDIVTLTGKFYRSFPSLDNIGFRKDIMAKEKPPVDDIPPVPEADDPVPF